MAVNDIVQTITNAKTDAQSLSEFMFKPASSMVARRLAPPMNTMNYFLQYFHGISSIYTQPTGYVTVSGIVRKTIGQMSIDAGNTVNAAVSAAAISNSIIPTTTLIKTVPISGTLGEARTLTDKNRENTSVMDFFTTNERNSYSASPTTFDASRPIQEFFDYIAANDVGVAYCSGDFKTSQELFLGNKGVCETKQVIGNFSITAMNAIYRMLLVQTGSDFQWEGRVRVIGTGGAGVRYRTCSIGVQFGGDKYASQSAFTAVSAHRFNYIGVYLANYSILSRMGTLDTLFCGSGSVTGDAADVYTFSGREDSPTSTGSNSLTQRSTITVSQLPPEFVDNKDSPVVIRIGDEFHYVFDIDRANNKLVVFPWLDVGVNSGEFSYCYGGGVVIRGSDAGVTNIDKIDAMHCSVGLWDTALYGAIVNNITTQHCFTGIAYGFGPSESHVGGLINNWYAEANKCDFLRVTSAALGVNINSKHEGNFDKFKNTIAALWAGGSRDYVGSMHTATVNHRGEVLSAQASGVFTTRALSVTSAQSEVINYYWVGATYNIQAPDMGVLRCFNYTHTKIFCIPNREEGFILPGTKFVAPQGYKVNGEDSVIFPRIRVGTVFDVAYIHSDKVFKVVANIPDWVFTKPYAEKTIPPNQTIETFISLGNMSESDIVSVSLSTPLQGTSTWAEALSNGIRIYHQNPTTTSVTIPACDVKIKVT